jgi:serine protease AprX
MSVRVPRYVVEYFLSGKTHPGALERFTQNGGIVSEVWLEFAKDLTKPVRVLIAPVEGVSAVDVGYVLHTCITQYRAGNDAKAPGYPSPRNKLSVSPLENFVAVTLYLDELLRVVLPLTRWWSERSIARLNQKWNKSGAALQKVLSNEIKLRLKQDGERPVAAAAGRTRRTRTRDIERKIREAAPIAALIGVFLAAQSDPVTAANIPAEPSKGDRRGGGQ